ncbi:hypothetical protein D3C87_1585240 [compost metagenome]
MLGTRALVVVIDPAVRLLVPPKIELTSTLEAIGTHCEPFHPAMVSLSGCALVRLEILLPASQVSVIAVAFVPLISQYSIVLTACNVPSNVADGNGPPAGSTG